MRLHINLKIKIYTIFMLFASIAPKLQASHLNRFLTPNEKLLKALDEEQSCRYWHDKKSKLEQAVKAIKQGANPAITHKKFTTFMRTIILHLTELAMELCKLEFVDVMQNPPCSQNILNLALEHNNPKVAMELLKNPKTQIGHGLFFAISHGMPDVALKLINDPRTDLNLRSRNCGGEKTILIKGGTTALRMAIDRNNEEEVIIALIKHPKATIDAKSLNEQDILRSFIKSLESRSPYRTREDSAVKIISLLLKRGACPFRQLNATNAPRFTKVKKILDQCEVACNKANAAVFLHLAEKYRLKNLQKLQQQNRAGTLDIPVILAKVYEFLEQKTEQESA